MLDRTMAGARGVLAVALAALALSTTACPTRTPLADAGGADAHDEDLAGGGDVQTEPGLPLGPCQPDQAGACATGARCVPGCPFGYHPKIKTRGGLCTVPGRPSCGCFANPSPCETPGLTCLLPGCCDFEGICVTPAEKAAICAGPDAVRFDCVSTL